MLLKYGYKWIEYISFEHEIEKNKKEYYRSLRNCQSQRPNEDVTEWINFFLKSLINLQQKLDQKIKKLGTETELSPKEKDVYSFVISHQKTKMNRKGIELLRQVREASKELEELLIQDILPNKFKQFIKTFVIGPNWTKGELILVNQKTQDKVGLAHIIMYEPDANNSKSYHACLDYIFDPTKLLVEIEKYKQKTENWNALGFVQIGLMHWADVLLLGVEESNQDEIWRYGTGLGETCTKLENDIFDFISKLEESIDQENLDDYKIDVNSIYKNLNESFWRHKNK